jgi:hypothetical protein
MFKTGDMVRHKTKKNMHGYVVHSYEAAKSYFLVRWFDEAHNEIVPIAYLIKV